MRQRIIVRRQGSDRRIETAQDLCCDIGAVCSHRQGPPHAGILQFLLPAVEQKTKGIRHDGLVIVRGKFRRITGRCSGAVFCCVILLISGNTFLPGPVFLPGAGAGERGLLLRRDSRERIHLPVQKTGILFVRIAADHPQNCIEGRFLSRVVIGVLFQQVSLPLPEGLDNIGAVSREGLPSRREYVRTLCLRILCRSVVFRVRSFCRPVTFCVRGLCPIGSFRIGTIRLVYAIRIGGIRPVFALRVGSIRSIAALRIGSIRSIAALRIGRFPADQLPDRQQGPGGTLPGKIGIGRRQADDQGIRILCRYIQSVLFSVEDVFISRNIPGQMAAVEDFRCGVCRLPEDRGKVSCLQCLPVRPAQVVLQGKGPHKPVLRNLPFPGGTRCRFSVFIQDRQSLADLLQEASRIRVHDPGRVRLPGHSRQVDAKGPVFCARSACGPCRPQRRSFCRPGGCRVQCGSGSRCPNSCRLLR